MPTVKIPYGKGEISLKAEACWEVLSGAIQELEPEQSEEEIILAAMARPIGSPRLEKLAMGKRTAAILLSDHTRPVPSKIILPLMLAALRRGSPHIQVTLLVATGCHRGSSPEELREKLGEDIFLNERVLVHDCDAQEQMVCLGPLPSGQPLWVNRHAVEVDLLLAEGFIEPHFFAGFSGGRKSVLPGVCARGSVLENHCAALIDHPLARPGILLGNPIHQDMTAAAGLARLQYVVNVVLNKKRRVVKAVAGDAVHAHSQGCAALLSACKVSPRQRGDIVITSNGGSPLDQNVYQAVKGLSTAEAAAKEGAVLIICAECADGIGGQAFYNALKQCASPQQLLQATRQVKASDTTPDQWQFQILSRILARHRVLFVTRPQLAQAITDMKMTYCETLDEALACARSIKKDPNIVVIPDGVATIVME